MREILFRAWSESRKCYEMNVGLNDGQPIRKGYQWFGRENDVHNSSPEQFTGLLDKNGKKIYEGDVLIYTGYDLMFTVIFDCGQFYGSGEYDNMNFDDTDSSEIEIIGNIHENPELLK